MPMVFILMEAMNVKKLIPSILLLLEGLTFLGGYRIKGIAHFMFGTWGMYVQSSLYDGVYGFSIMMVAKTGGAATVGQKRRQLAIRADPTAKCSMILARHTTQNLVNFVTRTATAAASWKSATTSLWPTKKSVKVSLKNSKNQMLTMARAWSALLPQKSTTQTSSKLA